MSRLTPGKLSVEFREGITPRGPIVPRRYTLTHSDITAELFLTIGLRYAYDKINAMRDEVLGEWIKIGEKYFYNVYLYINGEFGPYTPAIRNSIFRRELPLALESIRYGDKKFFNIHPKLDNASIIVYFNSTIPYFNRIENWGTFSNYKFIPDNFLGICNDPTIKCLPDYYNGIDFTFVKCLNSEKERDINLEKAIIKTFNLKPEVDKIRYYYNRIDLDGDGNPETFVYLVGSFVCGTGGCSAAIFRQSHDQYELLSQFSLVNNPIIISDTKTNGFKDIIMYVSGGGIKSFFAKLKYTGSAYPSNPSMEPQVNPGTKVRGIAIIADNIADNPGIKL